MGDDMTNEQAKMLQDMHDFWHSPATLDQPSRAVQLDRILALSRGTTFAGKALMMLFGVVVTIGTFWAAIKGYAGVP